MSELSRIAGMVLVMGLVGGAVWAAPAPAAAEEPGKAEVGWANGLGAIGVCLAAAASAAGGGFCIARIGSRCLDAIARQPEAAGSMFAPMLITAAMVEGSMLFAIVVCLLGVLGLFGVFT
jgi:F-type H+-transporting ATPase subunit c